MFSKSSGPVACVLLSRHVDFARGDLLLKVLPPRIFRQLGKDGNI